MRILLVVFGLAAFLAASQQALRALAPPEGGSLAERAIPAARAVPAPAAPVRNVLDGGLRGVAAPGEATLATFWATWCGPCRRELPRVAKLRERWRGRGVSAIAISVDSPDAAPTVPAHLAALGVGFEPLHDSEGAVAAAIGLAGTPTTIVVDSFGNVVAAFVGLGPWDDPATDRWLAALVAAETPEAARALLSSAPFARSQDRIGGD